MGLADKLKEAVSGSGGTQGTGMGGSGGTMGASGAAGGNPGQEDYVDRGLDFAEQKSGHQMNRNTNEKITDQARNLYEKTTGQNVSSKISN